MKEQNQMISCSLCFYYLYFGKGVYVGDSFICKECAEAVAGKVNTRAWVKVDTGQNKE